jgi:hypothetical protein
MFSGTCWGLTLGVWIVLGSVVRSDSQGNLETLHPPCTIR